MDKKKKWSHPDINDEHDISTTSGGKKNISYSFIDYVFALTLMMYVSYLFVLIYVWHSVYYDQSKDFEKYFAVI